MHTRLLALACLVTAAAFAADAPKLAAIAASGVDLRLGKAPVTDGRQGVDVRS